MEENNIIPITNKEKTKGRTKKGKYKDINEKLEAERILIPGEWKRQTFKGRRR